MRKQIIYSRVVGCDLDSKGQADFLMALASHNEKDVAITIERKRKKRSLNQNAFMHGPFFDAMLDMFDEFGIGDGEADAKLVKAVFKKQFGVKTLVKLPDGSEELIEKSTAEYTTTECEDCMEKARRRYAQYWQLPFPNEGQYAG